jgi:hypothetical protein
MNRSVTIPARPGKCRIHWTRNGVKKPPRGRVPRGGLIFLETAFPSVSDRHEVHRDYRQPGNCNSGDSQHDFLLHCRLRRRLVPFPTKGPGVFNQLREVHPSPSVSRQNEGFRSFGKCRAKKILLIVIQHITEYFNNQFSPKPVLACSCKFAKIQSAPNGHMSRNLSDV